MEKTKVGNLEEGRPNEKVLMVHKMEYYSTNLVKEYVGAEKLKSLIMMFPQHPRPNCLKLCAVGTTTGAADLRLSAAVEHA